MTYVVLLLIGYFVTNWLISAWFDTTTYILSKHKNVPIQSDEIKSLWTIVDDHRECELYLENNLAFWLNPNRYDQDGKLDLMAEPYQPKPVIKKQNLGTWTYYPVSTTPTKLLTRKI
jgi:hypothetical protein